MEPYQALISPVDRLYTVFIILSTLRLTPFLSQLTGIYAALGYFAGVAYTYSFFPYPESGAFTLPVFATYGALLLLSGFVAGGVAGQIRLHVDAALREAETKREMDRINELLVADLPSDKFVTFVVSLLDPESRKIQLLSAGHAPLMLYMAADNTVEISGAHGIPFGLMTGIPYGPPQEIEMAPGDILLLIADGFTEWMNPDEEEFGDERVAAVLKNCSDLPPADIISRLHTEVLDFKSGVTQADDLTVVIVKRIE